MKQIEYAILGIGLLSGVTAYLYYPQIGVLSALFVLFGVSWFLWQLTSFERAVSIAGFLKNPPIAAAMMFMGCFLYLSFNGYSSWNTWLYSFGIGLISGLVSIMVNTVWGMDPS